MTIFLISTRLFLKILQLLLLNQFRLLQQWQLQLVMLLSYQLCNTHPKLHHHMALRCQITLAMVLVEGLGLQLEVVFKCKPFSLSKLATRYHHQCNRLLPPRYLPPHLVSLNIPPNYNHRHNHRYRCSLRYGHRVMVNLNLSLNKHHQCCIKLHQHPSNNLLQ